MTTKDYIYLGLILLSALAFYCNGFYAGVYRCKRMYETLLDDAEVESTPDNPSLPEANLFAIEEPFDDHTLITSWYKRCFKVSNFSKHSMIF